MSFQIDSQWRFFGDHSKSGWIITFNFGAENIQSALIYNDAIRISYLNGQGQGYFCSGRPLIPCHQFFHLYDRYGYRFRHRGG